MFPLPYFHKNEYARGGPISVPIASQLALLLVLFSKRKGKHINVSIELLMVFDGEDNFMSELTDFTSKYIQNT